MKYLIVFIISFISIYLIYLLTVVLRKSKLDRYISGRQVQFFVRNYGLKFKNIKPTMFLNILSIINSLLMAITITIIAVIDNYILKFTAALAILIILLLLFYSLLGMYIRKKEK